jgi:hypothetical protein
MLAEMLEMLAQIAGADAGAIEMLAEMLEMLGPGAGADAGAIEMLAACWPSRRRSSQNRTK